MSTSATELARPIRVRAPTARRIVTALLSRLDHGTLTVVECGRATTYGVARPGGINAAVTVHRASFWRDVLLHRGTGLGGAYCTGAWDSDDLVAVLRLLALNLDKVNGVSRRLAPIRALMRRPGGRLVRMAKSRDRRNVRAHYDTGDDFFELFLDATMAYSSGIYPSAASTLEQASVNKFDEICRKLALGPGDHVVEIGGGWGGFAVHAASRYGCRVTTTTISRRQFDGATTLVHDAGLSHLVTVLAADYRELEGEYSHLVSVEMIEAVDWRLYDTYFKTCAQLLRADGRALVQCIVIDDAEYERAKTSVDFIKQYIFPGGGLPSVGAMVKSLTGATDLRVTHLEDLGEHYVRTLDDWRQRLDQRWGEARDLGFDDAFLRRWRFYFAYCAAGFAERRVSVVQMVLARPAWRGAIQERRAEGVNGSAA